MQNINYRKTFYFIQLVVIFFIQQSVLGQKGEIRGIIIDSKVKETLIGANVVIQGTTIGASTDLDGNFSLSVSPGTYNLEISYISYKIKIIEKIKVQNGQVNNLGKIELEQESTSLAEVTVQERKKTDTQIALISSIKAQNVAVTGITRDQIAKSQDKDAAEAIRRVPGITIMNNRFIVVRGLEDRYSAVWLNNSAAPSSESDKRAFSFDAVPSSAIDRMMVYKTPAPELPADFAGAAVLLYTKNLPDQNSLNIAYKAGFKSGTTFQDFTTYEGGRYDWMGFDDGTRKLPEDFPDIAAHSELHNFSDVPGNTPEVFTQKKVELERLSEEFNKIWSGYTKTAPFDQGFNVDYSHKFKSGSNHLGNITSLTYRNTYDFNDVYKSDHHDIDVLSSQLDSYDYRPYYDYQDKEFYNNTAFALMHNWSYQLKKGTLHEFRNLFNQLSSDWFIDRLGKNYYFDENSYRNGQELGFYSRKIYSGQLAAKHKFTDRIELDGTIGYSYADRNDPDIRRVMAFQTTNDSTSPYYQQYSVVIDQQAAPNYLGRLYLKTSENIWNFLMNYSHKFELAGIFPSFKTGFYIEDKNRSFDARNIAFTKATNYDFRKDSITYLRPVDLMFGDQYIDSTGIWVNENTSPTDSYKANNNLYAGYLALDIPATYWVSIYAGVRIESNRMKIYDFKSPVTGDTIAEIDTVNLFPSVNILFHINDKNKIRLAYGKTINRPEFREFAPFTFWDFVSSTSVSGNTTLKNAYIHNIDLRYEFYPSLSEMITFGLFYKNFINPIEQRLVPGAGDDKRSVYNANLLDAKSYGAEIEIRTSLKTIGKWLNLNHLQYFSIIANGAYLLTEITEVQDSANAFVRDKKRPMQGQSPYIVNAGIYYDNQNLGLMANIMYNIIGDRLVTVGDPNRPHVFEKSRNLLDFLISKKLGNHFEIKAGVSDILNEPVRYFQKTRINVRTENEAPVYEVIEVEKDYLYYKPGTRYNFGISYRF